MKKKGCLIPVLIVVVALAVGIGGWGQSNDKQSRKHK